MQWVHRRKNEMHFVDCQQINKKKSQPTLKNSSTQYIDLFSFNSARLLKHENKSVCLRERDEEKDIKNSFSFFKQLTKIPLNSNERGT